jgi:hypothetical protein
MLSYDQLTRDAIDRGGFSITLDGQRPSDGYAVALPGYEERISLSGLSTRDVADRIYSYVVAHGRLLRDPGAMLGGWISDGCLVLDISHVVQDRDSALVLGRLNGQDAIYAIAHGEELTCSV